MTDYADPNGQMAGMHMQQGAPQQQAQGYSGASAAGAVKRKSGSGAAGGLGAPAGGAAASAPNVAGAQQQQHPPSKVLHLRGLPPYTSESDVVSFFSSLPGISLTRILLLPNSNQAFLQLQSVEQAVQLVHMQAAQGGHLMIKGNKAVIVQFSNRQEIHTPATMAAAGGVAGGAAGAAAAAMQGGVIGGVAPDSQQAANSILIVTVLNTRVPVTLDHIHQIFKPCGEVLKIITFHKNGVFKALVQLASVEAAVHARLMLEGKDIFQGCCHLRIGFSSLHELHVKTPGSNARDFTSPSGATQTVRQEEGQQAHDSRPACVPAVSVQSAAR
jgi:polypyrimidine tract-binding protein 2